jgi:hypothetical protein
MENSMRIPLSTRLLALASIALAPSACYIEKVTDDDDDRSDGANAPVVGLSPNGLGYALRAKNFTSDENYGPVVQTQTVSVGTTVIGYASGSVTIEVRDQTSAVVLHQTVSHNLAQGSTLATGVPPFRVSLGFRRFSGSFSIAVGPGGSPR